MREKYVLCVCEREREREIETERYQQMIHVMIVSQSAEDSRAVGIAKENSRPQYLLISFFFGKLKLNII